MASPPRAGTLALTLLALVAFAGNSILCRLALSAPSIDPLGFTALRLGSGALTLLPFVRPRAAGARWSPAAAAALFVYAAAFSLAYVSLGAGVGALLLFGSVQATMIAAGLARGERLGGVQVLGLAAALGGLVLLVRPGLAAPRPLGAALMVAAGIAWGVYSLVGRGVASPMAATARNFLLAAPAALLLLLPAWRHVHLEPRGALLAATSGALTSGLGYVVWYAALRGHTATSAAIVQLAVPVLAALGGIALLGEELTARLALAGALTLGGVALAVLSRAPAARR